MTVPFTKGSYFHVNSVLGDCFTDEETEALREVLLSDRAGTRRDSPALLPACGVSGGASAAS